MRSSAWFVITILLSFLSLPLSAGDFRAGESVTVNDPSPGDIYVAGGTVVAAAPVQGDLNAAGGTISINGSVGQDIQAAGGNVDIRGSVKDDVRALGGTVTLQSDVAGDVVAAGGTITVQSPRIDGDLAAAGGNVIVQTNVKGKGLIAGGNISLNGSIGGDLEIRGESVRINGKVAGNARISARKIEIGPDAHFGGTVTYWSEGETLFPGVTARRDDSLRFENKEFHGESMIPGFLAAGIFGFVMSLLAGALSIGGIHIFFRKFLTDSAALLDRSPGVPLVKGVLYLLISPMGILLLFISLIGVPIALLWLSVFGFSFVFAKAVVASAAAVWILNRAGKSDQAFLVYVTSFGLFLGLKLIGLVPIVGFFAGLFWMVLASGLILERLAVIRRAS